jgi:membrane protease YdiL (CAAX protease family)
MLASAFSSAIGNLFLGLVVLGAVFVYWTLIRQISVRRAAVSLEPGIAPAKTFGLPEALLAAPLVLFLAANATAWIERDYQPSRIDNSALLGTFLLTVFIVCVIAAFLRLRGFDIDALAGFSKLTLTRALSTAVILLAAAWPLLSIADALTRAFGGSAARQEIVEFFSTSSTIQERVFIIVLAVVVAPLGEEFIFRFFLYRVFKRYFGITAGLIVNSILFAVAHSHLPSAAPLFVLASCLTLAYEWSGSILVSMGMHALFNSVQLLFLAFPQIFQQ